MPMAPLLPSTEATCPGPAPSPRAGASSGGGRWARWQPVAAYAGVLLACLAILTWSLRLWRLDLRVPLADSGDGLFHLMLVKGVIGQGWYLHNDSVGVPFGLDMHDFPMPDHLHFLMMKLLGLATRDAFVTVNLYHLLTFPLTALFALFALRQFRVAYPAAALAALLFAFLPYHFQRLVHLHLSAYYLVPLTVLVALWVFLGRLPLYRLTAAPGEKRWHLLSGQTLGAVLVCALTGLSGAYYAFFGCLLLAVAGVAAALFFRKLAPLAVAAALAGVIALAIGAALYPTVRYRQVHGPSPAARDNRAPGEAEIYAMKLTQLLLPIPGHRVPALAALRERYSSPPTPLVNENETASLGLLGSAGLLWLLGRLVLRRPARRQLKLADAVAILAVASVLLATLGGFSSLVALLVTPSIRCYNRMSVYIAFLAFFGLALVLDRLVRRVGTSRLKAAICWGVLAGLLALGALDQTSASYIPPHQALKERHAVLKDFVRRVEASLPRGSWVYQLPYMTFPEGVPPGAMGYYAHFLPYLYSRSLGWSYGGMDGRDADAWLRQLAEEPLAEQVKRIAHAGFAGIYLDRAGLPGRAPQMEAELARLLRAPPLVSSDGARVFFPLAAYAEDLRKGVSDPEWEALRRRALTPVLCFWRKGFLPHQTSPEESWNWCGPAGELVLKNPAAAPRKVKLCMQVQALHPQQSRLRVRGESLDVTTPIDSRPRPLEATLVLSPGQHVLHFNASNLPAHPNPLAFRVLNLKCRDVE
jgi:phosphoglycerol transferase